MAQLAGVAVGSQEGKEGFLAAIDHAEFSGVPLPGDALLVSVRVVKSFGRLHLVAGEVAVGGRILAAATLTLGIGTV
jgi:3-hydroxyacyl-[acyl-carrier-protein] dehydratase